LRHHHEGSNYQDLLNALVHSGRVSDACWLLDQFGPTNEILILDCLPASAIVFAGSLRVRGNIDVDSMVRVGRRIDVGVSIFVGEHLYGIQSTARSVLCAAQSIGRGTEVISFVTLSSAG
jgi:hypothetical protein